MTLNPFRVLVDYLRESRAAAERRAELDRLDRQAMLDTLTRIASSAIEVSRTNAEVMKTFLSSFQTSDAPRVREYDEEADADRYLKTRDSRNIEAYKALIDKLDTFALD